MQFSTSVEYAFRVLKVKRNKQMHISVVADSGNLFKHLLNNSAVVHRCHFSSIHPEKQMNNSPLN